MTADVPAGGAAAAMLPPSYAQELLWLLDRAAPGGTAYNVPRAQRVRGPLRPAALRRACDALAARHEILRTTYAFAGERPVQVVHPPGPVAFECVDLSGLPPARREEDAARLVRGWNARPFDLAREAPLRVGLVKLDECEHVLHVATHHIAFDGWSRRVFDRELDAFYAAFAAESVPALPELPIQYGDYAFWQREQVEGAELERLLAYWREELRDVDFALRLPRDAGEAAAAPAVVRSLVLSPATLERVRALGRRYDATPFVTLLAAYQCVLHRYTGQPDVLVGTPVAGRAEPETESLIGHFLNTTVQRARFAHDPAFGDLLVAVREGVLRGYEHQAVPFEKLALDVRRSGSSSGALFEAVFTMLDGDDAGLGRLGELELLPFSGDAGTTKFDLTLFMAERSGALTLTLRARATVWQPATVERFLRHLQTALESALEDPSVRVSQLRLLPDAERDELARFNAEANLDLGAPATVAGLFEATARRVPGRVALVAGRREATYAEIDALATAFAGRLRRVGVEPGEPVGIFAGRSLEAVVALLGIAKADAAFVPLSLPAPRLAMQVAAAGLRFVATAAPATAADLLPPAIRPISIWAGDGGEGAGAGDLPARRAVDDDALAYVLFTSGSTGVPKGVAVRRRSIVTYARAVSRVLAGTPPGTPGDGFAALDGLHFASVSPLAADLGYTALFPSLFAGGTLHLIPEDVCGDAGRFAAYLRERPLDVLKITPSHLQALLPEDDGRALGDALPRRALVVGGETLTFEFAQRLGGAGTCRVFNHYGPTETTVGACTFEVTPASLAAARASGARTVPVGAPLAGASCEVRDPSGALVPLGVAGELYVGGAGVARGYVGHEAAGGFLTLDTLGRAYRTGDRVRRLRNGTLEFLGRSDAQLKIRGHRVEPGEIEAVLAAHVDVAAAAVRAWEVRGDVVLAAYVVSKPGVAGPRAFTERLRSHAVALLPDYMLPRFLVLDALPLTANGKVDRSALPPPGEAADAVDRFVAPRTPEEAALAVIWETALRREPGTVGIRDDFIALGGHSLLAIRILGKISREFGVRLALRTLFDAATVERLAAAVESARASLAAGGDEAPALARVSRTAYRRPASGPVEPPR